MKSKEFDNEFDNEYLLCVGSDNMLDVGTKYPYSLVELCDSEKSLGKLIIDQKGGKLRFEGDVDKSAQVFFDEIIKKCAEDLK